MPEVVYNSAANEYLAITWGTNFTIHGQRVGAAGQPVGGILILAVGGGDGIGIGYSPVANGYDDGDLPSIRRLAKRLPDRSDGAAGASFQATVTGGANARQPQAAGSSQAARFLLVSTHEYAAVKSQMVQSRSKSGTPAAASPTADLHLRALHAGMVIPCVGWQRWIHADRQQRHLRVDWHQQRRLADIGQRRHEWDRQPVDRLHRGAEFLEFAAQRDDYDRGQVFSVSQAPTLPICRSRHDRRRSLGSSLVTTMAFLGSPSGRCQDRTSRPALGQWRSAGGRRVDADRHGGSEC